MHVGNDLNFYMLMYPDYLQTWLDTGHGRLIFFILAIFFTSETGQIWDFRTFPREHMQGMTWNLICWCIQTTSRHDYIPVTFCWYSLFWRFFNLVKLVKFWVSRHFSENACSEWPEIFHTDVSWPSSELVLFWSLSIFFLIFVISASLLLANLTSLWRLLDP